MDEKFKNTNFDNAKPVSATPALDKLQAMEATISLCLPASLKRSVEQVARDDGTSLNQFIVTAISE
jgi:predicted HicB family RNase H-like nuclease